ncbi:outer membrane lipoprotein-sorting protein [Rheinheimera texasensis]|uniref:outer membrane lipoprotein-sorting protein n=1 Tax=Rheinheimera texasensis TaxID=306205 RepID=UPI0006910436|nr:outer membrane lipoprotein-sorting protein [Rheinheimera texasensis]
MTATLNTFRRFTTVITTCVLLGSSLICSYATALPLPQAQQYLATAEQFRGPQQSFVLQGRIETIKAGRSEKMQPYQLLSGEDRKSLVIFTGGTSQGQKVLLQDQQFWLQLPGSRRALRITPLQKLMGEASSGDVATLNWQQDYQLVAADEQSDGIQLSLQAKREGLSYQRIELWVSNTDQFPLRAEFYLPSGKQAKSARFVRSQAGEAPRVVAMELLDRMHSKDVTVLHYDMVTPQTLPARLFNPQALSTVQAI